MNSFEDIFEDYIEKIVLKSRQKTPKYEIYVDIPLEDLMNKTLMKDIFEEYKKTFETFMIFHDVSLTENVSEIKFRVFRSKDCYSLGYCFLSETMSTSGSFHPGKKFDEDDYRKLIKKIGSYYEWKDKEENLSENMKKKQTSLFSLLYKGVVES
jgi:hypothetical protein